MRIIAKKYAQALYEITQDLDESKIPGVIDNFIRILIKNHDFGLTEGIIYEFEKISREKEGKVLVEVGRASRFNLAISKDRLKSRLESLLERKVILKEKIDPSLIGGIKLRFDDVIVDGTIKKKLAALKRNLEL